MHDRNQTWVFRLWGTAILTRRENGITGRIGSALLPPALAVAALFAPGTVAPALASSSPTPSDLLGAAMPSDSGLSSTGTMSVEAAGVKVTVTGLDATSPPTVTVTDSGSDTAPAGAQLTAPASTAAQYHGPAAQYQAPSTPEDAVQHVVPAVSGASAATSTNPHESGPARSSYPARAPAETRGSTRSCDTTDAAGAISISTGLPRAIWREVSAQICAAMSSLPPQFPSDIRPSSSAANSANCPLTCPVPKKPRTRARPLQSPTLVTTCCVHQGSLVHAPATPVHAAPSPRAALRPKAHGPGRGERPRRGPGRLPPLPLPAPAGMELGGAGGGSVFAPLFVALALWFLVHPPGLSVLRLPARIRSPTVPVDDRRERPG